MHQQQQHEEPREWHIPLVTIRRDGALALSPAAYELLRPADHVVLTYEAATHTLTISPAASDAHHSLTLVRDGTSGLIRARRFWRRSGIAEEVPYGHRYAAVASVTSAGSRCLTVHLLAAS